MSVNNHEASTTTFAAFGTVMSILTIGALIGNIFCFHYTRRLYGTRPSMALVLNLNMCDILVAVISWAAFMIQHVADRLDVGIHVIVHKVVWSVIVGLGNVTILNLVGLAADCFIALRWPLHYKEIATQRSVSMFILGVWTCSIISASGDFISAASQTTAELSFADAVHESFTLTRGSTTTHKLTASITMLLSNTISFLSLLTMTFMYSYILHKIKLIRISNNKLNQQAGRFKSEINAVRTTLFIFTSFLLLWLPTLVMNIISVSKPDFLSKLSHVQASIIGYTADTLLMLHSIVDSLIYGKRVFNTITRQRKSRRDNLEYSRANTIKRTSSTGLQKASQENGITSEYSSNSNRTYSSHHKVNGHCNNYTGNGSGSSSSPARDSAEQEAVDITPVDVTPVDVTAVNVTPVDVTPVDVTPVDVMAVDLNTDPHHQQITPDHSIFYINKSKVQTSTQNRIDAVSVDNSSLNSQTDITQSLNHHIQLQGLSSSSSAAAAVISVTSALHDHIVTADYDCSDRAEASADSMKRSEETDVQTIFRTHVHTLTVPPPPFSSSDYMNMKRSSLRSESSRSLRSATPSRVRFDLSHNTQQACHITSLNVHNTHEETTRTTAPTTKQSLSSHQSQTSELQHNDKDGTDAYTTSKVSHYDVQVLRLAGKATTPHCTCVCNTNSCDEASGIIQCTKL